MAATKAKNNDTGRMIIAMALTGVLAFGFFAIKSGGLSDKVAALRAGVPGSNNFRPFDINVFAKAQQENKPIVISITSSEKKCKQCHAQQEVLGEILPDPYFDDIVFMRIDSKKNQMAYFYFQKYHKVDKPTTLLAFRGPREVARSVEDMDHVSIVLTFMAAQ